MVLFVPGVKEVASVYRGGRCRQPGECGRIKLHLDSVREAYPDTADLGVFDVIDHLRSLGNESAGLLSGLRTAVYNRQVAILTECLASGEFLKSRLVFCRLSKK